MCAWSRVIKVCSCRRGRPPSYTVRNYKRCRGTTRRQTGLLSPGANGSSSLHSLVTMLRKLRRRTSDRMHPVPEFASGGLGWETLVGNGNDAEMYQSCQKSSRRAGFPPSQNFEPVVSRLSRLKLTLTIDKRGWRGWKEPPGAAPF